jgi:hypothetical protein
MIFAGIKNTFLKKNVEEGNCSYVRGIVMPLM